MSEAITGTAPEATPAPAAPATKADLISAATKALSGEEAAPAAPVAEKPPLPSTPEAPATVAALAAEESASALIRAKNELADGRKALEAERAAWKAEQAQTLARTQAMEKAWAEFERDPAAVVAAAKGKRSPEELARDLFLDTVEIDKLPPEQQGPVKAQRDQRRLEREIERLRAETTQAQEKQAQAQQQQQLAAYHAQIAAGLPAIGADAPRLKHLIGANAQAAMQLMWHHANVLAAQRPELGVMNAAQLATHVEQSLTPELELWEPYFKAKFEAEAAAQKQKAPPTKAAPAPTAPAEAPTLSPSLSGGAPVPVRPLSAQERIAAAARAWDTHN